MSEFNSEFNSTVTGLPYSRVMKIAIDYTAPLTAEIGVTTQRHVPLYDGSHTSIGSANTFNFTINPADLNTSVPLRDINTGELLGIDTPMLQIFGGINAVIRDREAALSTQVTPVEPIVE